MTETDDRILGLLRTNGPMTVRHIVEVYQIAYGYIDAHKLWAVADNAIRHNHVKRKGRYVGHWEME